MQFEFATATRIIFGAATVRQVAPMAKTLGRTALVLTGRSPARAKRLLDDLAAQGIQCATVRIEGEPGIRTIQSATAMAREAQCDFVIGLGGGSVLDAAKAVAALMTNAGDLMDYLEVVGGGKPLSKPAAACIAIPTTAGTGSEVTRNAVLFSPQHRLKVSLRSPLMLPRVAVVDPELTYALPAELTASTGLDALTQLIEPYVSVRANPLVDGLCREGMGRVARSLRRAYEHGDDPAARADMSLAALFGGLALANAGLGAVHGLAAPLGGMFDAPHGALCARLLPVATEVNIRALRARAPHSIALQRYDEIARILTGNERSKADDVVSWLCELCEALRIPALSRYGVTMADGAAVVEKAAVASSMKGNPIALTLAEMEEIFARSL